MICPQIKELANTQVIEQLRAIEFNRLPAVNTPKSIPISTTIVYALPPEFSYRLVTMIERLKKIPGRPILTKEIFVTPGKALMWPNNIYEWL